MRLILRFPEASRPQTPIPLDLAPLPHPQILSALCWMIYICTLNNLVGDLCIFNAAVSFSPFMVLVKYYSLSPSAPTSLNHCPLFGARNQLSSKHTVAEGTHTLARICFQLRLKKRITNNIMNESAIIESRPILYLFCMSIALVFLFTPCFLYVSAVWVSLTWNVHYKNYSPSWVVYPFWF